MDKNSVCVFCGKKLSAFRYDIVYCGAVAQVVCKDCKKEVDMLPEEERCRRALASGRADQPEKIREAMELAERAEQARMTCLRCGGKLRFGELQSLDNSPLRDSIFADTFEVLPAYCDQCGKIEFFDYEVLSKNKYTAYLMKKDATK